MPLAVEYYAKVRNNLCITYNGFNPEYLIQMRLILPYVKKKYPDINIILASSDNLFYTISELPDSVSKKDLIPTDYSYIKRIKDNKYVHPILEFLETEKIDCPVVCEKQKLNSESTECLICPDGALEEFSLIEKEVEFCKEYARRLGYNWTVIGSNICNYFKKCNYLPANQEKKKMLDGVGWVIGTENEYIYEAATMGIKTTLISKSNGIELYAKMFPDGGIIKLPLI